MKKMSGILLGIILFVSGCETLRFAPSEAQKQNAWLHNRTTQVVAETAKEEDTSAQLQTLAKLSELQSRAFVSYCGMPKEFPQAEMADDILRDSNIALAKSAISESAERPDAWQVADSALELAIGISALLGGVYGTRAIRFLRDARTKSKALKEIITGNEIFKKQNDPSIAAFKQAHGNQSPQTRQIVTQMKT
ncbi:MAG: hypothetical protein A2167_02790 [Planctomycetes bacterium RBG_13_46_10]|nr:MAG: hypothetical protein A2167_02790 [Planctomycetes bacterium RBG_13_46_10]